MFLSQWVRQQKVAPWWPIDGARPHINISLMLSLNSGQTSLLYHHSRSLTRQYTAAHKIHSHWLVVQGLIINWGNWEEILSNLIKLPLWNNRYKALSIEKCGIFFISGSISFPHPLKDQIITIFSRHCIFLLNWGQEFLYCRTELSDL